MTPPTPAEELHTLALQYEIDLEINTPASWFAGEGKLCDTVEDVERLFALMRADLAKHPRGT
jgi:hypothetical protein